MNWMGGNGIRLGVLSKRRKRKKSKQINTASVHSRQVRQRATRPKESITAVFFGGTVPKSVSTGRFSSSEVLCRDERRRSHSVTSRQEYRDTQFKRMTQLQTSVPEASLNGIQDGDQENRTQNGNQEQSVRDNTCSPMFQEKQDFSNENEGNHNFNGQMDKNMTATRYDFKSRRNAASQELKEFERPPQRTNGYPVPFLEAKQRQVSRHRNFNDTLPDFWKARKLDFQSAKAPGNHVASCSQDQDKSRCIQYGVPPILSLSNTHGNKTGSQSLGHISQPSQQVRMYLSNDPLHDLCSRRFRPKSGKHSINSISVSRPSPSTNRVNGSCSIADVRVSECESIHRGLDARDLENKSQNTPSQERNTTANERDCNACEGLSKSLISEKVCLTGQKVIPEKPNSFEDSLRVLETKSPVTCANGGQRSKLSHPLAHAPTSIHDSVNCLPTGAQRCVDALKPFGSPTSNPDIPDEYQASVPSIMKEPTQKLSRKIAPAVQIWHEIKDKDKAQVTKALQEVFQTEADVQALIDECLGALPPQQINCLKLLDRIVTVYVEKLPPEVWVQTATRLRALSTVGTIVYCMWRAKVLSRLEQTCSKTSEVCPEQDS